MKTKNGQKRKEKSQSKERQKKSVGVRENAGLKTMFFFFGLSLEGKPRGAQLACTKGIVILIPGSLSSLCETEILQCISWLVPRIRHLGLEL